MQQQKFYSVECLYSDGNKDNLQDYTRVEQFDTFEQAKEYIEFNLCDLESEFKGMSIVSSIYVYDDYNSCPDELLDTMTILAYFDKKELT